MANGICDNLLLAVYLSATCPVVAAPAMDEDMWQHPSTQLNIQKIKSYGNHMIPVDHGELASGLIGNGRMAEPENIIKWVESFFLNNGEFAGKKVMVTAGPTYEAIDPVRFIGNHSSGKMGIAIAKEFTKRGADVILVIGPVSQSLDEAIKTIKVTSTAEMYEACLKIFPDVDIVVMSAAVADYTVIDPSNEKIKKDSSQLVLELKKTTDILKVLGNTKRPNQFLAGFALETNNEKEFALKKLHSKNADMIVLNSLNDDGAGFGYDTNKITIFDKNGKEYHFDKKSKTEIAADIVNTILKISNA
jgi:phosphopantothenoylcysteine decarboxylase/phosphopantothenate--cysteine ligase